MDTHHPNRNEEIDDCTSHVYCNFAEANNGSERHRRVMTEEILKKHINIWLTDDILSINREKKEELLINFLNEEFGKLGHQEFTKQYLPYYDYFPKQY